MKIIKEKMDNTEKIFNIIAKTVNIAIGNTRTSSGWRRR